MRIFSGIQPTGRKHLGNLIGGFRQYAATQEQGDGVLLHRRPALDHRRLRPGRPARADVRPRGDAVRDRPRPRALDRLLPEPRDRARRGGVAALGRDELRPARQDDPVQGQGRPAGVRLRRPLHVPGADGRGHPPLPDRHRPDRRRPAAAPRARARRRRAVQLPLRRDLRRAARASTRRSAARIMDLQEPTRKMSTTGGTEQGTVLLLDEPDVLRDASSRRRSPTPAARCGAARTSRGSRT